MKSGFLSIILVLAFLPFLVQSLEVHNDVYVGMEEMKNTLILQQYVHEAIYEIENGFRLAVKDALQLVGPWMTEIQAKGVVCGSVTLWMLKHPDYSFTFVCNIFVDVYERKATLSEPGFIATTQIHNVNVTVKIHAGEVFRA